MMCNNPKLDLVNMNAYLNLVKFCPIEWKQNFGVNQGP